MNATIDIRAFGPLQVRRNGSALAVGGRTGRSVLAALLLSPRQPVGIDRLGQLVWSEGARPTHIDHAVQTHVTRLRRLLGPDVIVTDPSGYHLAVDSDRIDIKRFERQAREGDTWVARRDYPAATAHYHAALGECHHREPLIDLERTTAGRAERARLTELQLEVEERHAASALLAGEPIMSELEGLAVAEPLRELRWTVLMWAQASAGRQAAALRSYRRAQQSLREVGLLPGPDLRALEYRILNQDPSLVQPQLVEELLSVAM